MFLIGLLMFEGSAEFATNLTNKIWEGQIASILRSEKLPPYLENEYTQQLLDLIAKSSANAIIESGLKWGGRALMVAGVARVLTAIAGYGLMLQGLISDIDNTDGPDILCSVFA